MLIIFSLLGSKERRLGPSPRGRGGKLLMLCTARRQRLARWGPSECPQDWGAAKHLSDLYSDIPAMQGVLKPQDTCLQRFRLGWLGKNHNH